MKSASKLFPVPSAQGVSDPEGHVVDHHPMAQDGDGLGGVLVCGALEEDDPVTWETRALGGDTEGRRQGRPKSGPACVAGVGGPYKSDDAGERLTPDPAEQRGARVGSNFRREP
jgi:hypothetical protein